MEEAKEVEVELEAVEDKSNALEGARRGLFDELLAYAKFH